MIVGSVAGVLGMIASVTTNADTMNGVDLGRIGISGCGDVAIHLCCVVFTHGAEYVEHRCRAINGGGLMRYVRWDDEQRTGLDHASLVADCQSQFAAEQDTGLFGCIDSRSMKPMNILQW